MKLIACDVTNDRFTKVELGAKESVDVTWIINVAEDLKYVGIDGR